MPYVDSSLPIIVPNSEQKFVTDISAIPNLKLDYVVITAGVLRYPNVSFKDLSLCLGER